MSPNIPVRYFYPHGEIWTPPRYKKKKHAQIDIHIHIMRHLKAKSLKTNPCCGYELGVIFRQSLKLQTEPRGKQRSMSENHSASRGAPETSLQFNSGRQDVCCSPFLSSTKMSPAPVYVIATWCGEKTTTNTSSIFQSLNH